MAEDLFAPGPLRFTPTYQNVYPVKQYFDHQNLHIHSLGFYRFGVPELCRFVNHGVAPFRYSSTGPIADL